MISLNESLEIPDFIDWRTHGAVTLVKDQNSGRNCGSCYAFASISVLESHHFIKTGKLFDLSEQEAMDCSSGNDGCFGGVENLVFNYVIQNGIGLSKDYPYESKDGKCRSSYAPRSEVKLFGFAITVTQDEIKRAIVEYGPVIVGLNFIPKTFRFYKQGIYDDSDCTDKETNHAVVAVGFGKDEESGLDYFILRNSYSEAWGENGYIRIAMKSKTFYEPFYAYFPLMNESAGEKNLTKSFPRIKFTFKEILFAIVTAISITCSCFCITRCLRRRCR